MKLPDSMHLATLEPANLFLKLLYKMGFKRFGRKLIGSYKWGPMRKGENGLYFDMTCTGYKLELHPLDFDFGGYF